jgi:hypothetical protein
VVGGDLYMHPGAHVGGRAIAYGGGVYESALATVQGGVAAFRDFTYDVAATPDAYVLRYRALSPATVSTFALGGVYGVNIPSYDRTNGLSLPLSIVLTPGERLEVEPSITYRSQLGRVDPWVSASYQQSRLTSVHVGVGRSTFSNDSWIRSDLLNSLHYLAAGNDTRNYFRAERADLTLERAIEGVETSFGPYVGVRVERAHSVRPGLDASGGPWAFKGRDDRDDVLRPNPPVETTATGGHVSALRSLLAGSTFAWTPGDIVASARVDAELGNFDLSRSCALNCNAIPGSSFFQTTFNCAIGFPTFGLQRLDFSGHFVATAGNSPLQRFAWLGGPGTLPTLELLQLGGDELVFTEARYSIPLERVQLPFVGPPTLSFREILGGAGSSGFPEIRQAAGVRLAVSFVYGEVLVDPDRRHARFGVGFSIGR